MKRFIAISTMMLALCGCSEQTTTATQAVTSYHDTTGRDDVLSGGVRMIPIQTPKGTFRVWTKRVGNNPSAKVLLLHGGPGMTHEYFEAFDSFLPGASVEYYYYDQLGSAYSDQPEDPSLWDVPRFVEEVEQVRQALQLDKKNFYLLGQSWGGVLAIEYALAHQEHLKGLIISNMMASIPAYNEYAQKVFMPSIDPAVLKEVQDLEARQDTENPRYLELLIPHHYEKHILRMPFKDWPEPVLRSMNRINLDVYVPMQGPSELGASGKLLDWDRMNDLANIAVPTLVIAAQHDTMDPTYLRTMAQKLPKGRYHLCPNGSHLAMYDDQQAYFEGLLQFMRDVEAKRL